MNTLLPLNQTTPVSRPLNPLPHQLQSPLPYFLPKGGICFSQSPSWASQLQNLRSSPQPRILACLRVPWTARRSNQAILKEINPECSLEGLMLKLKLQYLGHLMWRANSLEKTLMLGKIEGQRRSGQQRMRWLHSIPDSMAMNLRKDNGGQRSLACYSPRGHKELNTNELMNSNLTALI